MSMRIKEAEIGVERTTIIESQLRSNAVERYVQCTSICFERQEVTHDFSCGAANAGAELVEIVQVGFIERVSHDFDVHLIQVFRCEGHGEVRSQRRVNQHQPIELTHIRRHSQRCNAVKHPQWMTLLQQLLQHKSMKSEAVYV